MNAPVPMMPAPESDAAHVARLYQQLRRIAQRQRRQHGDAATLDTTALVHEAWLHLEDRDQRQIAPRDFFAYAAQAMRNLHDRPCAAPAAAETRRRHGARGIE